MNTSVHGTYFGPPQLIWNVNLIFHRHLHAASAGIPRVHSYLIPVIGHLNPHEIQILASVQSRLHRPNFNFRLIPSFNSHSAVYIFERKSSTNVQRIRPVEHLRSRRAARCPRRTRSHRQNAHHGEQHPAYHLHVPHAFLRDSCESSGWFGSRGGIGGRGPNCNFIKFISSCRCIFSICIRSMSISCLSCAASFSITRIFPETVRKTSAAPPPFNAPSARTAPLPSSRSPYVTFSGNAGSTITRCPPPSCTCASTVTASFLGRYTLISPSAAANRHALVNFAFGPNHAVIPPAPVEAFTALCTCIK